MLTKLPLFAYIAEVEAVRSEGLTLPLTSNEVEPVFALGFAWSSSGRISSIYSAACATTRDGRGGERRCELRFAPRSPL